ncbi:Asp23/Gls24 family envelope stress response protein [Streptomyces sp. MI02-7b]|uniref:Asp23/Gls24 family envelope stress response protein n=1 Tax=Streptomyces sp. MI02-7b TaxID=462941 RepID=UPI0029B6C769|nr:Asp23/Gls24 family envelope stress response protein [Streptomyces sp. MI02-7b]MDX3074444.1 Asp23/Gls24 family envelope stress response protein [Streptomyces sp. MI02-7b]
MTTVEPARTSPVPLLAPAERGSLRIADRVPAKIAAQAARETLAGAPGREHVPRGAFPRASVSVHRDRMHVRLSVELGYPVDIAEVSRAVRRHVAERVEELTGIVVQGVVVEVERLHSQTSHAAEERRVR